MHGSRITRRIQFRLTRADLCFYNGDMHWVVEAGTFQVMVGSDSSFVENCVDSQLEK